MVSTVGTDGGVWNDEWRQRSRELLRLWRWEYLWPDNYTTTEQLER